MAFWVTQKIFTTTNYGELVSDVPSGVEKVEVQIEIISVNVNLLAASARYVATINGITSELRTFDFKYSGEGNPMLEAEHLLKLHFFEENS